MKFLDYITLNPKISLEKGKVYPFVEMANISTNARIPVLVEGKSFDSGVKFQDGDTVIARITPCLQNGKRFYCKDIGVGFGSTEYLVFRPKNDLVDNLYLYYYMKTEFIKQSMINSMTGATGRQRVNSDVFNDIKVDFPDIETQKKIGQTLSAYDDLIENNQKQIKLLEEAAQRLYKEWFVDFRFPGYEDTKFIDGIPDGWKNGILGDIAVFKRGKTITRAQVHKGDIPVVAGGKEPAYYHNKSNTASPVITVSASGNAGFVRLYYQDIWASDCSFLDISETSNLYFIYCYLKYKQDDIYAMQKGACQQHVNAREINSMELLIPTEKVLIEFRKITIEIFEKISIMNRQIFLSIQARDRLLPKLMSGEIEV
ncbi:restriction endonuclease subunit S [Campylobacter concisus]|uniref:restriction endonuclease subunit S n=1 Tax=Campylobacter concisus TaxID=199 RepID=UPI00130E5E78|nr:restriction endonuclease subunit S [Campylobacter concisus]